MLVDKYKARKNLWRIRESTLFLVAVLGGSLGIWLGMYAVRHKTRHPSFTLGIPKARKNLWRIRESTLFLVAVLGGSLGIWLGMYAVRHKTRHPSFTLGIPAILLAQTVAGIWQITK